MVVIVDNASLGYEFEFGTKEGDIIDSLIDLFIEKYGSSYYNKAVLVAVRHEIYFFVIKNNYGALHVDLLDSQLLTIINTTLSI